jgi:hypothetical protein
MKEGLTLNLLGGCGITVGSDRVVCGWYKLEVHEDDDAPFDEVAAAAMTPTAVVMVRCLGAIFTDVFGLILSTKLGVLRAGFCCGWVV